MCEEITKLISVSIVATRTNDGLEHHEVIQNYDTEDYLLPWENKMSYIQTDMLRNKEVNVVEYFRGMCECECVYTRQLEGSRSF